MIYFIPVGCLSVFDSKIIDSRSIKIQVDVPGIREISIFHLAKVVICISVDPNQVQVQVHSTSAVPRPHAPLHLLRQASLR